MGIFNYVMIKKIDVRGSKISFFSMNGNFLAIVVIQNIHLLLILFIMSVMFKELCASFVFQKGILGLQFHDKQLWVLIETPLLL